MARTGRRHRLSAIAASLLLLSGSALAQGAAAPAPAAPAAAAPGHGPTIEALAEIPFISDPVLSPDGKRIAAKVNVGGQEQLAIYDLASGPEGAPKIVDVPGTVRWFNWAGNGRLLVGHQMLTLFFGLLPAPMTRTLSYDLAADKIVKLGEHKGLFADDVIHIDPAGRFVLLSAQDTLTESPSVDRIDLATGAATEVQKKRHDIWNWVADSSGEIRGGISYSDRAWTVYARDAATGALRRIAKRKPPKDETAVDKIFLVPGSDSGFIVTNEPTGRFGVYRYSLATSEIGEPVFEHPEVDVTEVSLSSDGTRVEAAFYEADRPEVAWLEPAFKTLQARIDKALAGKVNRILGRSADGTIVLVWSTSADHPGAYYVYDIKAKRMNAFAAPHGDLVDQTFAEVKPVRYTARDGLSIPGYLTLPRGREAKGLPLILMPHGGPFARDNYRFDPWVQLLASRGYAVLQANFRGSTGYGRAYVEKGHGQWGLAMQDDLDDGVSWLIDQGIADPKRICIMGASYGGYAALWGAIRSPERYRCAVSFAGVTDVRAMLKYDAKVLMAPRYFKDWRARVQGEEKRDLNAISPLQQAARLKVPVLIAHGGRDDIVPFDQGTKMVAALRARGAPVHAAYYPGSGHSFATSADSADFLRRVEAFLEVHNPADPAALRGPREAKLVAGDFYASDYPEKARRKKEQGTVAISFDVAADGRVTGCRTEKGSGSAELDKQTCVLAEERLQYRPALDAQGQRIAARAGREVDWKIDKGAFSVTTR
jgi:TonB family protein